MVSNTSTPPPSPYVHAMRYSRLTFFYDGIVRLTTRETAFKRYMIDQVAANEGDRILDVGSGTGTLAIGIQRTCPTSLVTGLDGDPAILERAKAKANRTGVAPRWREGMSYGLPFEENSYSWVVTSLLFHHLSDVDKQRTLSESLRVLRPGGTLMLADWGQARGVLSRGAFLVVQLVDGFKNTAANVRGDLPLLIEDAGFVEIEERRRFSTPLGVLSVYLARKPDQRQVDWERT